MEKKKSNPAPLTEVVALQDENSKLQDEIVTLKVKNFSNLNRIRSLEKKLASSTDVTFQEMLKKIDGGKMEKLDAIPPDPQNRNGA